MGCSPEAWRLGGWPLTFGSSPEPSDPAAAGGMPRRTISASLVCLHAHALPTLTTPELPEGPASYPAGLRGSRAAGVGTGGLADPAQPTSAPSAAPWIQQLACWGAGLDRLSRAPTLKVTPSSLARVRPAPVVRHLSRETAPGPRRCRPRAWWPCRPFHLPGSLRPGRSAPRLRGPEKRRVCQSVGCGLSVCDGQPAS